MGKKEISYRVDIYSRATLCLLATSVASQTRQRRNVIDKVQEGKATEDFTCQILQLTDVREMRSVLRFTFLPKDPEYAADILDTANQESGSGMISIILSSGAIQRPNEGSVTSTRQLT